MAASPLIAAVLVHRRERRDGPGAEVASLTDAPTHRVNIPSGQTKLRCNARERAKSNCGRIANLRQESWRMSNLTNFPLLVLALSSSGLWLAAWIGAWFHKRRRDPEEELREDFGLILGATLTLLGLIIGFSFSMAASRYDQRKNYEEQEANAIGTEYVRADFLSPADAAKVRTLLRSYLDQRILFYTTGTEQEVRQIDARTAQLQAELWSVIAAAAAAQPTPIVALAVSGINDVLNSQGYTQAAWWNRIPIAAWGLMAAIAISCNLLFGYGSRSTKAGAKLLVVLPIIISIALMLIADIDSPRHGFIRVSPQNLVSLAESLRTN
jgi:hypothetical protein